MAKKLKVWNGASWEDVTFAITPPTTNVTNEFSTNQIIDASTNVAALRITQRGSGEAFRVEDDTNPDSSPFVINASGNVGIGTASPSDTLTVTRSSGEAVLGIRNSGTASAWLTLSPGSSGAAYIHNIGNTPTVFTTNSTERIRIDADGQVNVTNSKFIVNSSLSVTGANWAESMLHITGTSAAANNPSMSWHAPGASAMAMWHPRGSQAIQIMGNTGTVSTGSGTMTIRNIAVSTSSPSGGNDGDIWAVYTA